MAPGSGSFLQLIEYDRTTSRNIETINFKPPLGTCSISFDYQHSAQVSTFSLSLSVNDQKPSLIWNHRSRRPSLQGIWYSTAVNLGKVRSHFKLVFELRTGFSMSQTEYVGIRNVQFDSNCFVEEMSPVRPLSILSYLCIIICFIGINL